MHRQRHEPDFCADDQYIFDCVGPHLARASVLRREVNDPLPRAETGVVVLGATGNALFLNTPARRFLGTTPPQRIIAALPAQGTGVITLAAQRFRVSRLPWTAATLLRPFAMEEGVADPIDCLTIVERSEERSSTAIRQRAGAVIAVLQPFVQRVDLTLRLEKYRLSPRQSEIAVWVLRGVANGEIARRIFISEQTVREHCQEIYHRVGVHTRVELLAKVLGTVSLATEPGDTNR